MYHTGLDPFTREEVFVARHLRDRKLQRALMQFFKPENSFVVFKALEQAGRMDLIGAGCDALIPAHPPRQAIDARRRLANQTARGVVVLSDYSHTVANPARGEKPGERGLNHGKKNGYRPGRKSHQRKQGK